MRIKQLSHFLPMTRRHLPTMLGGAACVYPSLKVTPQSIPGSVTKEEKPMTQSAPLGMDVNAPNTDGVTATNSQQPQ